MAEGSISHIVEALLLVHARASGYSDEAADERLAGFQELRTDQEFTTTREVLHAWDLWLAEAES